MNTLKTVIQSFKGLTTHDLYEILKLRAARRYSSQTNDIAVMNDRNLLHIVLIYLVVINMVTFLIYGIDKWKAKKSKWRIRETVLLSLAVLGGSMGAWLGMKVWHHKTKHKKFKYGVPAIIIVQVALIAYYLYR